MSKIFITKNEIIKKFKTKSNYFINGYFEGYNNPKQSLEDINKFLTSGRLEELSEKARYYLEGKSAGVEDRRKIML